jgi:predicted metal-dependent phosphoesterase TrpH
MRPSRTGSDRHALAVELAERCAPLLSPHDWEGVSSALGQMHEHLLEDLPEEGECDEVFGDMVANLIDRLGNPEISSWPQACIYGRSADAGHRERAALWIRRRQH